MDDLRIRTYMLGEVQTNCYIAYHKDRQQAVIIDPADDADQIVRNCMSLNVTPCAILLTHGHFDHILAVGDIAKQFHIPVYAGAEEKAILKDPDANLSISWGGKPVIIEHASYLRDKEKLELAGFTWEVIFTPGHTTGSVCYYIADEDVLFSGDTLFAESYGRTDMPGGSTQAIICSIRERLLGLPKSTMVYPGHGVATTIGHEKQYNPAVYDL